MHRVLALALVLLTLAGCSKKEAAASAAPAGANAAPMAAASAAAPAMGATVPAPGRSLVVTMDVAIAVARVDLAAARLRSAAEQAGGFVADAQMTGTDDEQSAHLELRVPASEVSRVRATFTDVGSVTSLSEKVEDVTEQRADLQARLHNARVQEKRLLEILGGKAATIGELVEAEREVARVRENIERLEAQERGLTNKIDLATIRVSLAGQSAAAWQTPGPSLAKAGRAGVRAAAALAVYGGMAIAMAGPIVVPVLALVLAIALAVRSRRRALVARES